MDNKKRKLKSIDKTTWNKIFRNFLSTYVLNKSQLIFFMDPTSKLKIIFNFTELWRKMFPNGIFLGLKAFF